MRKASICSRRCGTFGELLPSVVDRRLSPPACDAVLQVAAVNSLRYGLNAGCSIHQSNHTSAGSYFSTSSVARALQSTWNSSFGGPSRDRPPRLAAAVLRSPSTEILLIRARSRDGVGEPRLRGRAARLDPPRSAIGPATSHQATQLIAATQPHRQNRALEPPGCLG